ncbi:hypothetical protein GCM10010399_61630 [Dactylosporangium fulvum]|uniref:Uncharacterized protein n=1 Tax=Dactylosporangium fulvum TaxID=53359 RepID=A0ABY5VNR8_9ACTN|nr:hypothetical protein [Dactylosporangium fulvum]UWP78724.1 hypothetical protein Dfulv_26505 [Dactylosporangium fulvum]
MGVMHVSTQVRVVYAAVVTTALLLAADVTLTSIALRNLGHLHTKLMSAHSLSQVRVDLTNNLVISAVGAVLVGLLVVFVRSPSNKVRVALWVIAPSLALSLLCGLVGGPEWAVAPTGVEPELLRTEYARAVPGWYVTFHGITGLLAAVLLIFAAIFVTRADLREYYLDNIDGTRYRSWVDRG